MPRQPYHEYLRLVTLSDVILDTPHFNGGATTFDALAMGVPIVTLPGAYMRGRQTYALYKRMGLMDCVACTPQEYVYKAVRLATNHSYRKEIRQKILAGSNLIFEDNGMVKELERHLMATVRDCCIKSLRRAISIYAASRGIARSTNRKNWVLRAPATELPVMANAGARLGLRPSIRCGGRI